MDDVLSKIIDEFASFLFIFSRQATLVSLVKDGVVDMDECESFVSRKHDMRVAFLSIVFV